MNNEKRIPSCPDPETLEKSFRNGLSAAAQESLIDHVLACPACRARFDILREVQKDINSRKRTFRRLAARSRREAIAAVRPASSGKPLRRLTRPWAFAAAALVLVLGGAVALFTLSDRSQRGVERGGGDAELKIYPPLVLSDGKTILFRWKSVPEADGYHFDLTDENLRIIIPRDSVKATAFIFNSDRFSPLDPGKTYIWRVDAYNDDERMIRKGEFLFKYRKK